MSNYSLVAMFMSILLAGCAKQDAVREPSKAATWPDKCDYPKCASVPSGDLGDRLVLRPSGQKIKIREITDESEFATHEKVVLNNVQNDCGKDYVYFADKSVMWVNWNPIDRDYDLTIWFPGGTSIAYNKVSLRPERKTKSGQPETVGGHAYWLHGSARALPPKNWPIDFYVYLYDEQGQDGMPMDKRYLVEVYDQPCLNDSPVMNGNIGYPGDPPLSVHPSRPRQPTTGNGWEPHHQ